MKSILSLFKSNENKIYSSNRMQSPSKRDLIIEQCSGETRDFEDWAYMDKEDLNANRSIIRIIFSPENLSSFREDPPIRVFIPVKNSTAVNNPHEKSENNSYVPVEISRFSEVVNTIENKNRLKKNNITIPFIEVWIDTKNVRISV